MDNSIIGANNKTDIFLQNYQIFAQFTTIFNIKIPFSILPDSKQVSKAYQQRWHVLHWQKMLLCVCVSGWVGVHTLGSKKKKKKPIPITVLGHAVHVCKHYEDKQLCALALHFWAEVSVLHSVMNFKTVELLNKKRGTSAFPLWHVSLRFVRHTKQASDLNWPNRHRQQK